MERLWEPRGLGEDERRDSEGRSQRVFWRKKELGFTGEGGDVTESAF